MRSELPKSWKKVKLGEICLFRNGKKPDPVLAFKEGPYIIYGGNGKYASTTRHNSENVCVVGRVGAYCGSVHYEKQKCWVSDNAIQVFGKNADALNAEYLYNMLVFARLNKLQIGTSQPLLTQGILKNIEMNLPPLSLQKAVARLLSCLDSKIELNNKINENLEAQAQAIFKSWFVDFEPFQDGGFVKSELGFIPEGWRVGKLEEIAQITMGQSPKGTTYNEDGVGEVFYQGRAEFGWRFPSRRLFTTDPKRMAEKNDVLMSVRAPVGDINVANESCCIGRGLASLRNTTYPSFLLYLMHSIKERLNQFNAEGTVFGSINQGSLKSMAVIIPPDNVVYQFENNVASFDQMIWSLSKQNSTLVALRDTLLPKLMSGEIEVPVD